MLEWFLTVIQIRHLAEGCLSTWAEESGIEEPSNLLMITLPPEPQPLVRQGGKYETSKDEREGNTEGTEHTRNKLK